MRIARELLGGHWKSSHAWILSSLLFALALAILVFSLVMGISPASAISLAFSALAVAGAILADAHTLRRNERNAIRWMKLSLAALGLGALGEFLMIHFQVTSSTVLATFFLLITVAVSANGIARMTYPKVSSHSVEQENSHMDESEDSTSADHDPNSDDDVPGDNVTSGS